MATIPTVYYQTTTDVYNEKVMDARSIGLLDPNRTMLNVQSALTSADKTDIYRFRMMKDGPIGISFLARTAEGAETTGKIELLNKAGQVVADNTATSGKLKDNWDKLVATDLDGKKGDYYIRVSRDRTTPVSTPIQYNVQIRSTFDYRDDYTTIEKPATSINNTSYGMNATVSTLATQMKSSLDGVSKESDAQKLLSTLSIMV